MTAGQKHVGQLAGVIIGNSNADYISIKDVTVVVGGITPLPTDYAARIANFLRHYLGTPDHPIPFGGRKTDLNRLDAWLNDPTQPPRLLLVAPAGRGKSALLVHWVQALIEREDLEVVFVPVSIRFRTNLASVIFAALAARLSKLHGKVVPSTLDVSGEVWRGTATDLLGSPLPNNRRLVVILDGLDEAADWTPGPDLLPYTLPPSTRVVVSARYLATYPDAAAWLDRLGWNGTDRGQTMELPTLTREGVAEVLNSAGLHLDRLSGKVDVVAELHRLSEGDPLLLELYVGALSTKAEGSTRLRPDDLPNCPPGLTAFFHRWFEEQRTLWGDKAPINEPIVQDLLEVLACALGPLSRNDLLEYGQVSEEVRFNSWTLDEGLRHLARFVIGDGQEQGYVFSHTRLGMYFNERLGANQRRAVMGRLLEWGADTLAKLKEGILVPENVSPYLVEHYRAHLEGANRAADSFLPLISDGWARAWFAREDSYAGFLMDIQRVSQVAAQTNAEAARGGQPVPYLGTEIRCALCQVSVFSLASRIPPELLAALVRHDVIKERRALDYALQNPDEKMRSAAVVSLSPEFRSAHVKDRALEAASSFREAQSRIEALSALAPVLSLIQRNAVLEMATQIANLFWRGCLLEALAPHLPLDQLERAREIAEGMSTSWAGNFPKEDALSAVVERYAQLGRIDVAVAVLESLSPPHCWIKGASRVVRFLPAPQRNALLQEALKRTRAIDNPYYRAEAYLALAPCLKLLEGDERLKILREALRAARALGRNATTIKWLTVLVPFLPTRFQHRTLDYVSRIHDRVDTQSFFDPLGARLALSIHYVQLVGAVDKALTIVSTRTRDIERLLGQAALAHHLPEPTRAAVVAKCAAQADALDIHSRLRVIGLLADHLPPAERTEVLASAQTSMFLIGDREECRRASVLIAPVLAESGDIARARELALAAEGSPYLRAGALMRIAATVPNNDERRNVLKEALGAAISIDTLEWDRNESLAAVATQLAESGCIDEAIDAIRQISSRGDASKALAKTLPHIAKRDVAWAWKICGEIAPPWPHDPLLALIPHLTGSELDNAVLQARTLWHGDDVMLAAATRLAALDNLDGALTEARAIENPRRRLNALLEILHRLSAGDARHASALADACEAAEQIDHAAEQAQALIEIARNLPESERTDVLNHAEKLELEAISEGGNAADAVMGFVDEFQDQDSLIAEALKLTLARNPSWLSSALIDHLSYPMLEEADRAVVQGVDNDYERDEIRARIVVRLAHLGFGAEALSRISSLTRREFIAKALAEIGGYLDPASLDIAVATQLQRFDSYESGWLAEALAGLAEHLSGSALDQAIDAACSISRKGHRETALAPLAVRIRSLPAEVLYPMWRQRMLPVLAKRTRDEFVSDLAALAPMIGRLGGSSALTQICEGIDDVTQWWP